MDKCCKMESTECLGCCLVTLRYFCKGLDKVGNIAWAASYDSIGAFSFTTKGKKSLKNVIFFYFFFSFFFFRITLLVTLHTFDMGEGLFGRWDQSGTSFFQFAIIFVFFVKPFVMGTKTTFLRSMANHGRITVLQAKKGD